MPFIGNAPATHFETTPAVQRFSGNGSTKTFTLNRTVASKQSILVSVDGVVQDTNSYTVPDGITLTFADGDAPSSGTNNIFVNYLDLARGSTTIPAENKGNFKGGGLFRTNAKNLTTNITILSTENANVTGPFTVDSGVTLTVESGGTLVTL